MRFFKQNHNGIPKLITLANLSFGFLAVLLPFANLEEQQVYLIAACLIFLAIICDGLDGLAARKLNAISVEGAELDNLADMVAFGIAPAVLMYSFVFSDLDKLSVPRIGIPFGMICTLVWPICAACRLARFHANKQNKALVESQDAFSGFPSPAAGSMAVVIPIVFGEHFLSAPIFVPIILYLFFALNMISTFCYYKYHSILFHLSHTAFWLTFVFFIVLFSLILQFGTYFHAMLVVFVCTTGYALSGLVHFIIHVFYKDRVDKTVSL